MGKIETLTLSRSLSPLLLPQAFAQPGSTADSKSGTAHDKKREGSLRTRTS